MTTIAEQRNFSIKKRKEKGVCLEAKRDRTEGQDGGTERRTLVSGGSFLRWDQIEQG